MHGKKVVRYAIGSLVVLLFIAGCGGPAGTPTAVLPTDTPEPATPTTRPPYITDGFPTGKFKSTDSDCQAVEFRDNGTARWLGGGWEVGDRYGVIGDIWVEMTFVENTGRQVPVTYKWSFDGYDLDFELIGTDLRNHRRKCVDTLVYTFVREVDPTTPVDTPPFPTGRFVSEDGTRAFEFDTDGNWFYFENDLENPLRSGMYVTNKNYYTEATQNDMAYVESLEREAMVPVTYSWTFVDGVLKFQLWGEDVMETRRVAYEEQSYIQVDE